MRQVEETGERTQYTGDQRGDRRVEKRQDTGERRRSLELGRGCWKWVVKNLGEKCIKLELSKTEENTW